MDSDPGVKIFIREVSTRKRSRKPPILLIHGGGSGAVNSFDLPVPGGSFAGDLAMAGFDVYIMNVRGWELSTRPDYDTTQRFRIAGSALEAAHDIDAAVDFVREHSGRSQVTLFGWASGGHWAGYYTCMYPEKVSGLMLLNTLYNVRAPWSFTEQFRNPLDTSQFNYAAMPVLRRSHVSEVLAAWDASIPAADKSAYRDTAVAGAFVRSFVRFYADSVLSVPGGYRAEAFYTAHGRGLWHAKDIKVPVLAMRGQFDTWSRAEDLQALEERLVAAPVKRFVTFPLGGHYVFLERGDKGRDALIAEIKGFNQMRVRKLREVD